MPYDPVYTNIWQSYNGIWNYEPQFNTFQFEGFQDGIPIYSNEPRPNPKTGRMEYTGQMNGMTYYYKDKNGKLTLRSDAPSDNWSPSGLMRTLGSIVTGGISDLPFSVYDTIKNSTTRDWQKLLTGGTSEIVRGYQSGKPLDGWMNFFGGIINNPLINTFDDWFTSIGTTPQRLLRDTGVMPEDVYAKNYKYTKDIAHAVGALFAGGASGLLGDSGAIAGIGTGLDSGLAQQIGAAELYNAAPVLGSSGANALWQVGNTLSNAASNPFIQKLATTGLKQAGKIATAELLPSILGTSGGSSLINTSPPQSVSPYNIGGLLDTSTPELLNRSSMKSTQPSFERTELPKLASYGDEKSKKLAELLTDPYKNYTLNDYALYKTDPEQLRQFLDAQYVA